MVLKEKKSPFPTDSQNSGIFRMQAACWLTMSSHRPSCAQSHSYPVAKELSQEKNPVQFQTANRFLSMVCPSDCSETGWKCCLNEQLGSVPWKSRQRSLSPWRCRKWNSQTRAPKLTSSSSQGSANREGQEKQMDRRIGSFDSSVLKRLKRWCSGYPPRRSRFRHGNAVSARRFPESALDPDQPQNTFAVWLVRIWKTVLLFRRKLQEVRFTSWNKKMAFMSEWEHILITYNKNSRISDIFIKCLKRDFAIKIKIEELREMHDMDNWWVVRSSDSIQGFQLSALSL